MKVAWLLFLGAFFFATYNFANYAASQRSYVPVLAFTWEHYIPFVPWTIVPYWSTDLFYALSFTQCRSRGEVNIHGKRLVAMQLFATACFLAFPLRCSFPAQPVTGWEHNWFAALGAFDRPFNQAPSLHAGLSLILCTRFRPWLAPWFFVMALSTLTTHQHQFIDIPTGAWAGLLVLAAFPQNRKAAPAVRLTLYYLAAAVACTAAAFYFQGPTWVLCWPAFSLSMVAAAYWSGDHKWLKADLLFYTTVAWINSRCWTRSEPARVHLTDGVWIGRAPLPWQRKGIKSIVDLAPELKLKAEEHIPILDLTIPSDDQLSEAVQAIERLAAVRPTLVCCALGYSRSAIVSAAWLISKGHPDAIAQVRRARPQSVISEAHQMRLNQWTVRFQA